MAYIIPTVPITIKYNSYIPVLSDTANYIIGSEQLVSNRIDINIFIFIWFAGVIFFAAKNIINHYMFTNMLRKSSRFRYFTDDKIKVISNPFISTPLIYGFFKPVIAIPEKVMGSDALNLIIEHETVHWKRRDLIIKLIMMAVGIINWYNPFMKYILTEMSAQCEISCDAEVVKNKAKKERYIYSEEIVRIATRDDKNAEVIASAFGNRKKYIKKRVINIIEEKQKTMKKSIHLILFSVIILLFCMFFLSATYAEKTVEYGSLTITVPHYWQAEINSNGILNLKCGPIVMCEIGATNGKNFTDNDTYYNKISVKNTNIWNQPNDVENFKLGGQRQHTYYDETNRCTYTVNFSHNCIDYSGILKTILIP